MKQHKRRRKERILNDFTDARTKRTGMNVRQADEARSTHEKDVAKRHAYSRRMRKQKLRVVDCSPTKSEIIEKSIDSPFNYVYV